MADLIPMPFGLDPDMTQALLRDLERRLTSGDDLGSRGVHIRHLSCGLRQMLDALKQSLGHLDPADAVNAKLIEAGHAMIEIAEFKLVAANAAV